MKSLFSLSLSILFIFLSFGCSTVKSEGLPRWENGHHWGGVGFDHEGKYTRFSAKATVEEEDMIEIWVDDEKTYKGFNQAVLKKESTIITSLRCWKAQRHIYSPIACLFLKKQIQSLSGIGELEILGLNRHLILSSHVDFSILSNL